MNETELAQKLGIAESAFGSAGSGLGYPDKTKKCLIFPQWVENRNTLVQICNTPANND